MIALVPGHRKLVTVIQDSIAVLDTCTCKNKEDPYKTKGARVAKTL